MTAIVLPIFDGNAACAEVAPELWFPEKGGKVKFAEDLCKRCEIQLPCLQWSLDNKEQWGTWGGVSENQRKQILRRRDAA